MKTYCKGIDITDPEVIFPWVLDCLEGSGLELEENLKAETQKKNRNRPKWNRGDYQKMMAGYGKYSILEIQNSVASRNLTPLLDIAHCIAEDICERIQNSNLKLKPLRFSTIKDGISGKERDIVHESPMQQVMEYVAVGAMRPLLKAKIMPHQYASVKRRGQIAGKRTIERWMRRKKSVRWFAKGDIEKCFPSISHNTVFQLLRRDIHKNKTLLWFVFAILSTYQIMRNGEYKILGLVIGAVLSQWLCNYVMSYLYRYLSDLYKVKNSRAGPKKIRLIRKVLFYMDDILILGSRKVDVQSAMRKATEWAKKALRLTIKPSWSVEKVTVKNIDMMGYVVGPNATTIRSRIFLRARRQFLRAWKSMRCNRFLSLVRAQSVISYGGYFKYSNSVYIRTKLHFCEVIKMARQSVRHYALAQKSIGAVAA